MASSKRFEQWLAEVEEQYILTPFGWHPYDLDRDWWLQLFIDHWSPTRAYRWHNEGHYGEPEDDEDWFNLAG